MLISKVQISVKTLKITLKEKRNGSEKVFKNSLKSNENWPHADFADSRTKLESEIAARFGVNWLRLSAVSFSATRDKETEELEIPEISIEGSFEIADKAAPVDAEAGMSRIILEFSKSEYETAGFIDSLKLFYAEIEAYVKGKRAQEELPLDSAAGNSKNKKGGRK